MTGGFLRTVFSVATGIGTSVLAGFDEVIR